MSKVTMAWTNGYGKEVRREVNQQINLEDYVGTPGYAMLVVAANRDLAIADIERFFGLRDVERSRSWIQRRRWLFDKEDAIHPNGPKPNQDGRDDRAVAIMREFPCVSVRHLVVLLKERGITRSREWVRQRRCD